MFNPTQIDDRVKTALFNKIDAMDRKRLDGSDTNFFIKNSLEPQDDTNPIEQHLYRGCFAKVNVAVPEFTNKQKSEFIQKPISISSYITNKFDENNELESVTQKNAPLAFQQGFQEKSDNRFLGESGITSISVEQQEYYTNKFTIGWVCPDPVYFEDVFEPSFLKLGAYCSIEFGWGNNDSSMDQIESLSIEEMKKLLKTPGRLTERNLKSSGNYYCGVGTVVKFDWKIQESGIYAGDLQILTAGASPFLETTQGTANSSDTIPVKKIKNTLERQVLAKRILEDEKVRNDLKDEEVKQLKKDLVTAASIKDTLQANSVAFNLAMKNLDTVMDYFLDDSGQKSERGELFTNRKEQLDIYKSPDIAALNYKYQPGLLRFQVLKNSETIEMILKNDDYKIVPDYLKKRYFATWGWFEDNILKTYFEMKSGDDLVQTVDSRKVTKTQKSAPPIVTYDYKYEDNRCNSSDYLYSLGLDSVVLPGKTHPIMKDGFRKIKNDLFSQSIESFYPAQQRMNLERIRLIYQLMDEKFPKFSSYDYSKEKVEYANLPGPVEGSSEELVDVGNPKYGIIRNMVFPIEMFQKHFQNTPSLRQGLRNFWADVTNQYGGYWGFELGQDGDNQSHIGVFDSYYDNVKTDDTSKTSTDEDLKGIFEFSVLSDKSIVKSFDVNLDLGAEAATLARYGGFTKANTGTTTIDGKKELGLEAWNILTSTKEERDIKTLEDLKRYREIRQEGLIDLTYTSEEDTKFTTNIDLQKKLSEDDLKVIEKLETQRTNFIQGIGCYDNRGNFSTYFKQTMIYLINYSDLENSGSLIERSRPMIPVSISMTLDGVSGLAVGNLFKVDYLPELYRRKYIYFMITKVGHKITTAGWDTEIEGVMIADLPEYWKTSGRSLSPGIENYIELFVITEIDEFDKFRFKAFADGRQIDFDELKAYNARKEQIQSFYDSRKDLQKGTSNKFDSGATGLKNRFLAYETEYIELRDFYEIIDRTEDIAAIDNDYNTIRSFVEGVLQRQKTALTIKDSPESIRRRKEARDIYREKQSKVFKYGSSKGDMMMME